MFMSDALRRSLRCALSCPARSFSGPVGRRLVLGVETSCDDTGAAVVDEEGTVLGESLHSQKDVHIKTGGIIPVVAQKLHQENIARVVQNALDWSGVAPGDLSAVATTVKPGLALSLRVGLEYSLSFVHKHKKSFIPVHHMEAHALTVRMIQPMPFPFLVLLVSGGHGLLAMARGVDDFLLLGRALDEAPGDTLDKVARRLSLQSRPEWAVCSGGQALECVARAGDRSRFCFTLPMAQRYDCHLSFAGLRNQVTRAIEMKEEEEGVRPGEVLSCAGDIAAATQHAVAAHLANRTHRAILFSKANGLLPQSDAALVVSGGVASNQYIRHTLKMVTDATGLQLICPPPELCTDNGVMIAWNGIERLREEKGVLTHGQHVMYEPKAPFGTDITQQVKEAAIKLPQLKLDMC
ncbi:tRNA N6-adenosine threonylcarbamoyltransferase, mitochondrial [Paramormyrops kingsleyae]|uniref:N(6)-L-threonylcarbamoyladenine synthase n=1 Tax=Paramormyrops kingsleyae TaxID=1676925 RepID=A0A3B3T030_9TELE|nr:probable tRNA N6-adenosine threonylcarbamoyltransferase, mitochondrial [Paramormyrops kingsleyae]